MIGPASRRLSVAPMLGRTDRHERFFLRLISRHTLLYTEMITTGALLYGDSVRFLAYDAMEHPVAMQLGGSDPMALAECARLAEDHGYDEINLNCGCPSPRVRLGRFGACLLAEPALVARCVREMRRVVSIPVTVKTRIGIDNQDSYHALAGFVREVAEAGCETFIIHARKAWLARRPADQPDSLAPKTDLVAGDGSHERSRGLSPAQNREVPPLRYDVAHRLKAEFSQLEIVLNGGIRDLDSVREQLCVCDGVMIGRAAYHDPYLLAEADASIFDDPHPIPSRREVIERFIPYMRKQMRNGVPLGRMTRHILGLFAGQPGARAWRRRLSENVCRPGAGIEVIQDALQRSACC
uniref:tRNA-dihydrouridine(20/20a) synthase n=1 Tax=Candidatus Kentrum sp. UNK TaxID=2126344 RepID=A0A451A6K6_9GAMM|nr:MAG: tRNA-U16,U17-dihydrouridine synthase [Candidatus Kentron sp. UNK]VFK68897.1 MAG: tRNA-U16,U17-dihydrouridine synthase [Candidatus Kentron sp. UNK]